MTDSLPSLGSRSSPPATAAARTGLVQHHGHALIWVRTGTAHVSIDDAPAIHLTGGNGIWIPANSWNHHTVVTEPGTVAFPYWPDAGRDLGAPDEPTRFTVPDDWQSWLIQYFNLQVTPFRGRGYSQDMIAELLRRPGSRPPAPAWRDERAAPLDPPVLPKAAAARTVAEALLRDPAQSLSIQEWAARVASSPRTLLRDFLADTGLTFEQWRLGCRLTAAVELLAAGYEVDQVAARVGFASRGGFRRAFQQRFGPTPHEFARQLAARAPTGRAAKDRQADDLVRILRGADASATAPELLPPVETPTHANESHVLSWIYRGSGYIDIGDRRYERQRGVATWIPAEIEHTSGLRENSISLPLGNADTTDLQLTEPLQVPFSPAWDDYLMFCSISARTLLRPHGYDPRRILDLFAEQVAAQRALSVPMPTDSPARAVAMEYLRRIGAAGEPVLDVPASVHRAFREQTGMSFARWRYAARMRIARDLLAGGAKPSAVARRVGYAHLPTFSAAFSRFHGLSPREYLEREAGRR
ncbi:helix-turn-helix domain-containing protein [Microbacterium sp.]|uniref:helix-turn-helix domain-containing protein n=1 Tax=Microbacterium sp. TaxID=51671 RepID=UPI003C7909EA